MAIIKKTPFFPRFLLKRMSYYNEKHSIIEDFEETFQEIAQKEGNLQAKLWYWSSTLKSLPGYIKLIICWSLAMLKNYLKIALRNIQRYKGYSFINILGLSVGLACCILIMMWVMDELSYDGFYENENQIYRVNSIDHSAGEMKPSAGPPAPIGPVLVNDFPEIQQFTRVQSGWGGWYLHYGEKNFSDEKLCCADPTFFEIFNFEFLHGDPKTALQDRYSIVLTEELAKKCFGDEDPMGKVIKMSDTDLKVSGVIKNVPRNSHLHFDYIFPIINMTDWRSSQINSWKYDQFATYILLDEKADAKKVGKKISGIVKNYETDSKIEIYLQSLNKIHLHSSHINTWMLEYPNKGHIKYIYIFSLIAFCILLVACINFINLTTARSATRIREVGIRKVSGAFKNDLIKQFFGETLLLSIIGLIFALLLAKFFLPTFNELTGKILSYNLISNYKALLGVFVIVFLTGIISGSYPSLYLSSFKPVGVFRAKGQFSSAKGVTLRKILVIGQFAFTIILIFVTVVVYKQLQFIHNKDLGFDQNNVVSLSQYSMNYEAIKNKLLQNPNITNICRAFPPGQGFRGTTEVDWEGKDPTQEVMFYSDWGDHDFFDTFRLKMAEGRFYSREIVSDTSSFVINEAAAKVMNFESLIGKRMTYKGKTGNIIGVVKDYHGGSLHSPILPKVIECKGGFFLCIRYREGTTAETLNFLEAEWDKYAQGRPFRFQLLDEQIANYYFNERKIERIFRYFTILAVFIGCLGLFGLASFMAERRTKEIGIRKVLGAKVSEIVFLLSKEFIKWIIIANIIAWPLAYFIGNKWLQNFAYRTGIDWEIFLFSTSMALLIAIGTVSYQSIKAASTNPVESLRYE